VKNLCPCVTVDGFVEREKQIKARLRA